MDNRCIEGLESLPDPLRGCVLTVGNFDGVHLGHQRILETARSLADVENLPVATMTFEPPPDAVLRPENVPRRITPPEERTRLLLETGSDYVVIVPADREFLSMTPEDFIEQILVRRVAPKHVVEGQNFFFGRERAGNVEVLCRAAPTGGFSMHVVDPVMLDLPGGRTRVSSELIRRLIQSGRLADAGRCLGREFALFGRVARGTGRGGKLLGFPTVNLEFGAQVCPPDGVYAGRAILDNDEYPAAISIGTSPTLDGEGRKVEAFLIDAGGDFYERRMGLRFVRHIRDQQQFGGVEALKVQIAKDVQRVREIVG